MKKSIIIAMSLVFLMPSKRVEITPTAELLMVKNVEIVQSIPIVVEPVIVEPVRVYYDVELTGYDNCYLCTQNGNGQTASGKIASQGTIAVPIEINLGTSIIINGEQFRAEDRGGAIKIRNDGVWVFDVWFSSHQEALDFGRVHARMYEHDGEYIIEY